MSEKNTQQDENRPRSTRGGRLALLVSLLVSLLTLGALTAILWLGYPHWQAMQHEMLSLQKRLQDSLQIQSELKVSMQHARQLMQQAPAQQVALDTQQQLLSKTQTAMEQREVELRATIAELRMLTGKPDDRWMVAEAEYLLQLAGARLRLAGDTITAIAAIQQAQQRLLETGDSQWADIRQQLARDVERLNTAKRPDLNQLSADINALIVQIATLQPAYRRAITPDSGIESTTDSSNQTTDKSWLSLWHTLTSNTQDSIRIRRHDQAPAALLAPEQEQLLYQSLGLILESARLAMLQRNTEMFQHNLRRSGDWIRNRFNPEQATAIEMLGRIEQLAQLNLTPALPDISSSLQALQARKALLTSPSHNAVDQP